MTGMVQFEGEAGGGGLVKVFKGLRVGWRTLVQQEETKKKPTKEQINDKQPHVLSTKD